ncbi:MULTISPECIES: DUF1416 domain-containing protein [Actinomycetes]|uniref:DUF1416 domain-containing protein n=1 Tax=Amycolatopsis dendrobii TaxID=2760662 RepID=A0A7W3VYX3_9PSEU|nr:MULTISPECIES: DUF1416 domain-containing protein [Actinomycetes]ATY15454.1 DUF1416 domain-containing protein [Amycolatopsis sp. AA4]EFL11720.1 SseC protein [Streptomyces sp. AA4]MBB1155710.1 DUF1416 domain-containing protein [Amycolatopsis dendrobii]UKD52914.1 DUF1416 domain-containing protein [Amycolatopsis sp. FU40]
MADGCSAPAQVATPADFDTNGQVVLAGKVTGAEGPVGGAFVRLLDGGGDFAGEVVSSADGDFRFYAAEGSWTVRALHRTGNGEANVTAEGPGLHQLAISVA